MVRIVYRHFVNSTDRVEQCKGRALVRLCSPIYCRFATPEGGWWGRCRLSPGIGTVVVGGMHAASSLALVFVPLAYKLLDDLSCWRTGKLKKTSQKVTA